MKKSLLLAAGLVIAATSAQAQLTEPLKELNMRITGISANGEWAVSDDDVLNALTIINNTSGQTWVYSAENSDQTYSGGVGRFVADNGVVVGNTFETDIPVYWENGEWTMLPMTDNDYAGFATAVTPDASIIAGYVMVSAIDIDADFVMTVPVIWERRSDGSYGPYTLLPYPTKDWTGRTPNYFLVNDISADGNVIACDLYDYSGNSQEPYILRRDAEGKWAYEAVRPDLLNPEGLEFPPYPGEFDTPAPSPEEFMSEEELAAYLADLDEYQSRPYPQLEDFMSPDEIAAYLAAVNAYNEDPENNPEPYILDFISDEHYNAYLAAVDAYRTVEPPKPENYMTAVEIAAYNDAYDAWEVLHDQWFDLFVEWDDVYAEILGNPDVPSFQQNSARISPNGKYMVFSAMTFDFENLNPWGWPAEVCVPYVFDLDDDENLTLVTGGITDVYATQVYDNGGVLGTAPSSSELRSAVISESLGQDVVDVADLLEQRDPSLYEWMTQNMLITINEEVYNPDTDEFDLITKEVMATGTPVTSADRTVMGSWLYNTWDWDAEFFYVSYLLPTEELSGIKAVNTDRADFGATLGRDGSLRISGDVATVSIYDVNGRLVFSASNPADGTRTGLTNGVYVVKATARDSRNAISKSIL